MDMILRTADLKDIFMKAVKAAMEGGRKDVWNRSI